MNAAKPPLYAEHSASSATKHLSAYEVWLQGLKTSTSKMGKEEEDVALAFFIDSLLAWLY